MTCTGETQYNEILGTVEFCLLYQKSINNTKQINLFHWDQRKQFVISGILFNISDLFISSFHCTDPK